MDPIKEAFAKAKQDIQELRDQIASFSLQLTEIKSLLSSPNTPTNQQTDTSQNTTFQHITPTDKLNEPYNLPKYALKTPISSISSGNGGVPTDRQTNQQTDRHIQNLDKFGSKVEIASPIDRAEHLSHILASLDTIKRDIRTQFKRLTPQEMLVFATLYQLEEEGNAVDYPRIATRLNLSESSIRDYILKLEKKGIPLQKHKQNNKKILLSISPDFKKLASLKTLMTLREL